MPRMDHYKRWYITGPGSSPKPRPEQDDDDLVGHSTSFTSLWPLFIEDLTKEFSVDKSKQFKDK